MSSVVLALVLVLPFSQFLPDDLHLLPEIIVPLVLIQYGLRFLLDPGFQPEDLYLLPQKFYGVFQAAGRVQLAQELCLIPEIDSGILRDGVRQEAVILACHHAQLNGLSGVLKHLQIQAVQGICLPAQGTETGAVLGPGNGNCLHDSTEIGLRLAQLRDFAPADASNQHLVALPLGFEDLFDLCHGSDSIKIPKLRVIHQQILLGNQKQGLILFHRFFQSPGGFAPSDFEMDNLLWEDCQPPKG